MHLQPQRLAADRDAVDLAELLGGQRRAEIGVARLDQLQGLGRLLARPRFLELRAVAPCSW